MRQIAHRYTIRTPKIYLTYHTVTVSMTIKVYPNEILELTICMKIFKSKLLWTSLTVVGTDSSKKDMKTNTRNNNEFDYTRK